MLTRLQPAFSSRYLTQDIMAELRNTELPIFSAVQLPTKVEVTKKHNGELHKMHVSVHSYTA
jgi:hypothetical protein